MAIKNLMNTNIGIHIDKRMQIFIYDTVCLNEYTEEDIQTIKNYENPNDKDLHSLIDEFVKACKVFKAKYLLMKKELPPPDHVTFKSELIVNSLSRRFVIHEITNPSVDATSDNI